ncbi:MAG: Uma2 family endonuclease, partial [Myxococcaceae bacterium]
MGEVISESNASHDRVVKLRAYHQAGVPHSWLIDPRDRTHPTARHRAACFEAELTALFGRWSATKKLCTPPPGDGSWCDMSTSTRTRRMPAAHWLPHASTGAGWASPVRLPLLAFFLAQLVSGCQCAKDTSTARPRIEAEPASLDFGSTAPGLPLERFVTLRNPGAATL